MEILTAPSVLNTIQSKTSTKSLAIFAEIFSAVSQNKPSNAINTYEKASASDQFAIMRPQTTENGQKGVLIFMHNSSKLCRV